MMYQLVSGGEPWLADASKHVCAYLSSADNTEERRLRVGSVVWQCHNESCHQNPQCLEVRRKFLAATRKFKRSMDKKRWRKSDYMLRHSRVMQRLPTTACQEEGSQGLVEDSSGEQGRHGCEERVGVRKNWDE